MRGTGPGLAMAAQPRFVEVYASSSLDEDLRMALGDVGQDANPGVKQLSRPHCSGGDTAFSNLSSYRA